MSQSITIGSKTITIPGIVSVTQDAIQISIPQNQTIQFADQLQIGTSTAQITVTQDTNMVYVDDYGAVGDGVTDDTSAIQAAIDDLSSNDVLKFSPSKTYLITDNLTITQLIQIDGQGATLKRANKNITTITANVSNGATEIPVTDASIFSVGQEVVILDSTGTYSGQGFAENSAQSSGAGQVIQSINGNTLTVSPAVNGNFLSGDTIVQVYDMISIVFTVGKVVLKDLVFDGNSSNNDATYDWRLNITLSRMPEQSIVTGCIFKNIPCENVFINGGVTVINCYAENLNGSFVHISKSASDKGVLISNNILSDICKIDNDINEHSEAVVTFSNESNNIVFSNNYVETVNGWILGNIGADDNNLTVSGNVIKSCLAVANMANSSSTPKNITINGNILQDCEKISIISTGTIQDALGFDSIIISNNKITNTLLSFQNCSNIQINNNVIEYTDYTYDFTRTSDREKTAIFLNGCANIEISNNIITDYNEVESTNIISCIHFDVTTRRDFIKSDVSTDTVYYYTGRNVSITNNNINGFSNGICDENQSNFSGNGSYISGLIKGNTIVMRNDVAANDGIRALPGFLVCDNTIYADSNTTRCIWVFGASSANQSNFNGAIVVNNRVYGGAKTIELNATHNYNCEIRYNYLTAAVSGSSVNSNVADNFTLNINENSVPLDLIRENSDFY